ncbi:class I fructose-bisphosphate aldolase [Pseudomonas fluorescens]|jgi:hypothetical protein|uniref:class I fructose-bisphosphate aldolase n=1 Tax=Pseudomonas TaxID=286 RepID=UPI001A93237A|nr:MULTISPECIES: class I fructose-bisphosphate aldolase [Pseudomonas]MDZ5432447.1 class I fructose-bisphosphate aldolase [Pseudomonas fluorescens]
MSTVRISNLPARILFSAITELARQAGLEYSNAVNVNRREPAIEFLDAKWKGLDPGETKTFRDEFIRAFSDAYAASGFSDGQSGAGGAATRTVPAAVPVVVFLSGGQSEEEASINEFRWKSASA